MNKIIDFCLKGIMILCLIIGVGLLSWSGKEFYLNSKSEKETTSEAIELIERGKEEKIKRSEFEPEFGEASGILQIEKIDANIPIVEGTHEDDLRKGVGHYKGTAYPLDDDQIVLSGHRDTVFKRMSEIEIGDIMTVRMPYGDFDYEIINTKIVPADDLSIIVPHDEEILTVTTCYPFRYIGNAPDRFIVDAKPIYDREKYSEISSSKVKTN